MSPLKHRETCLYCGGKNWLKYKHWRICQDCNPQEAAAVIRNTPYVPQLLDKGIPKRRPM